MKRLAIMVLYDSNGKIDLYVDYLLKAVQKLLSKLIIVVNGAICKEDYVRLNGFTKSIYVRDNEGFDAGAYKDIFLNFIPKVEWMHYDEILLMNDTFYGPFYPLSDVWDRFNNEKIDFWGMTRHPKGSYVDGTEMPSHIQAYFMVVKRKLLRSDEFFTFWENMPYPRDMEEAINNFEIRFTTYFEERGFIGKALMDLGNASFMEEDNRNPYLYYNLWLIKEKRIPFLKKKSLLLQLPGYIDTIDAISYIENENCYDVTRIWENIIRLSKENSFKSIFNYYELERFYYGHERIFIYGCGQYGKKIQRYFECRKWIYISFFVTRDEDKLENCEKYGDIDLKGSDGVILALGKKALEEVWPIVKHDLDISQILIPQI